VQDGRVIRRITGFHQDEAGDWVAELSCLHNQHVRHRPPFQERAWVLDPDGRGQRVGAAIDCPLCDRAELPADVSLLRVGGPWDQDTLPAGLRRRHRTAEGVWGVLEVTEGAVGLHIGTDPPLERSIGPGGSHAIPPATPHQLDLEGPFRLILQFWGRSAGSDLTLRDGRVVSIRRMAPDDDDRLVEFHGRLSPETVYLRFFSAHPRLLPAEVNRFTHLDQHDRVALVAVDRQGRIQAVGRYDRLPGTDEAEVAFVVADEVQGQGLGRELLARLAPIAREEGIRRFVAETLVGNQPMLKVFRASGLTPRTHLADGVMHVTMDLEGADGEPAPDRDQTPSRGATSEK
jgi:RimJ/RimL family protein N-acetyltransferase